MTFLRKSINLEPQIDPMEKTEVFLQPMQNIIPTLSGISQNAVEYLASLEWEKGRKKHERQGLVTLMGHL